MGDFHLWMVMGGTVGMMILIFYSVEVIASWFWIRGLFMGGGDDHHDCNHDV